MSSSTEQVEAQAADFLVRRMEKDWSAEDQRELDQWIGQSMAHRAAFWRLEYGAGKIERLLDDREVDQQDWHEAPRKSAGPAWWKVAATLFLTVGVFGAYFIHERRSPAGPTRSVEYTTRFGGISEATLPDGTRLTLNSATSVRFEESRAQRVLWIKAGEAFFSVTHDASRPFIVHSGDQAVTVVGTKFSVDRQPEKTIVSVLEGKVRINNPDGATLTRGQTAIMDRASTLIISKNPEALERELSWRTGMLSFAETPLREAAARFNRYNERKIIVEDEEAGNTKIGGSFKLANEEQFVHILQTAYGFKVTPNEGEFRISSR